MRKINNRKSLILAAGGGKYIPNIIRGGNAIPLGDNFYYIKGRKHSAGGVDIGADPKTGLEVEGEEVMKVTPKEVRVYSSVPFLQGNSPAELVMGGANPDAVFNAQEEFKDRNRINDDGSKYKHGGDARTNKSNKQNADTIGNNNTKFNPNDFSIRSINRNSIGNNKTLTKASFKDGTYIEFKESPYSKIDSLVANHFNGEQPLWDAHRLIRTVRSGLTGNPAKAALNIINVGSINKASDMIGDIIGKEKVIDVTDYGRTNKKPLGGNKTTVQQDAIANYKPDLKYNNYENFEKAKSNAFHRVRQRNRLATNVAKGIVQVVDPTGISSYGDIVNDIQRDSHWLRTTMDVLSALPALNVVSSLARKTKIGKNVFRDLNLYYKADEYKPLVNDFVKGGKEAFENGDKYSIGFALRAADNILDRYKKVDAKIKPIEKGQYAVRGFAQNEDIKDAIDDATNKKPLGGNLPTNQNDFLDTWNASRLDTGRYNNQLGDGRLERQAESRNTAREFHSPIGFAMNYGKRAAIRTPYMSDTDYRKEIARNAQNMKLRLNTPETGQGVIGGAYHAPTHSSYINQEEFAKDPTVRTHENAHASRATEQEQVISDILGSSSSSTYLRRPTEVYSRLMQFRQANNLDPNTVYDKDSFRELRKTATDYNLINTFKEDEVIDLLNNVAMRNDPNQLNLNNINLNTVPVYAAKYGTKRKSKMGKVISINGNVRNGLIHTPSREAFAYGGERKPRFNGRYSKPGLHNLSLLASAIIMPKGTVDKEPEKPRRVGWADLHNRLVTADISQKPLDAKRDNTFVAHVISETEKRTRKYAYGGDNKPGTYKGKQLYQLPFDPDGLYIQQADEFGDIGYIKVEDGEWINENRQPQQNNTTKRKPINIDSIANAKRKETADWIIDKFNLKLRNYVDGVTGAAPVIKQNNKSIRQLTRNIVNGLTNNAPTYKKNGETHYFVESPTVSVPNSDYDMDALQRMILSLPGGTRSNTSSSSTGSNNKRQSISIPVASINSLDGSKVVSASDENAAMIRRNLAPTVVNRLTKNANNDINYLPIQEDIAKTRNLDNIQFGINLGSSAIDALMSNIFVNQLHSYTPPTITASTISNPGDIKLNEEDLKDIPEPILMAAAKLKTRYNANPQLAKIEDETRRTMRDIDRNTSNSRVGLARKQLTALRGQEAKNQVYAQKENIETELINKDKLNQQEVTARNLARYDQYNQALAAQMANRARLRLAADTANVQNRLAVSTANANLKAQADQFNAGNRINSLIHQARIDGAKAEARANIVSSLLGNVGNAFNVWNRNKRQAKLDEETLKVLGLRAPNVNKLMLRTLGINK